MRNLGNLLSCIKYPSVTEKSMRLADDRQYTFIVDRKLTKTEIKFVLEKIFAKHKYLRISLDKYSLNQIYFMSHLMI